MIDAVSFSDEDAQESEEYSGSAELARQAELAQFARHADARRSAESELQKSSEDSVEMSADKIQLVTPKRRANPSAFGFSTAEILQAKEKMRSSGSALVGMTSTFAVRKSTAFTPVMERKAAVEDVNGDDICFQSRAQRAAALEKQFQSILKK